MVKKGDFIEVEYTGYVDGEIFDTTSEEVAKKEGLHNPNMTYGPITICLGEKHLVGKLDDKLEGKEPGKEYDIELTSDEAFGPKSAKMLQMIPLKKFKQNDMNPMPGMQINVDNNIGTVKSVSGGRVIVDFNHPLAGKDVMYKVRIDRKVEDTKEQLESLLQLELNRKDIGIELKDGKATVTMKGFDAPEGFGEAVTERVQRVIPSIKEVTFKKEKTDK